MIAMSSTNFPSKTTSGNKTSIARVPHSRKKASSTPIPSSQSTQDANDGTTAVGRPRKGSLADFLFGFMYEEDETLEDSYYRSTVEPSTRIWNPLNLALFLSCFLNQAASAVPVALVTVLTERFHPLPASRIATAAALGSASGKLLNGPVGDLAGARRTSVLYSVALSFALLGLAGAVTPSQVVLACFLTEFVASVQWPTVIVTLAAHHRGDTTGKYEAGIWVTSLGSRLGSLSSVLVSCTLLRWQWHWRFLALLVGSWTALMASSITYLYVTDTPDHKHAPQHPIDITQFEKWFPPNSKRSKLSQCMGMIKYICVDTHILPSVRYIVSRPTFWIVAVAHVGACMVRTSERLLGSYFLETRSVDDPSRASIFAVALSTGMVAGLTIAGNAFATSAERPRKWLVSRLYLLTIISCYALAFWSLPWVERAIPADVRSIFQCMAAACAGFGIAVPYYHIPSLVGATFPHKALYVAYTDALGLVTATTIWHSILPGPNSWPYAWAGVALVVVIAGLFMVEFMEHSFCRPKHGGTFEQTILFA